MHTRGQQLRFSGFLSQRGLRWFRRLVVLATQLVARIYGPSEYICPFRRRFETPSAAGLALAVVEQKAEQAGEAELNQILTELEEATPRLDGSAEQTP